MPSPLEKLVARAPTGDLGPVVLVHGDLVLAEPAAQQVALALAKSVGCAVETHRNPARLSSLLQDLRTLALFVPAKVLLVVGSGLLADRAAAAGLIDEAAAALPLTGEELTPAGRAGAAKLLQALRVFGLDPRAGEEATLLAALPAWALEGGKARKGKARGKAEVLQLRASLADLLGAARAADIVGWAEGDLAELGAILASGLPRGHSLVLAESAVASDHPIVKTLAERGATLGLGNVERDRGGAFSGLEPVALELERQTATAIARDALLELARRTLRQDERAGVADRADGDSTGRLASEYRKLAELAGGERITLQMVEETVADRGQEDVWQLLDAIAAGRGGEALDRLTRLLRVADDPLQARLSFFNLFAGFARQLAAVAGLLQATGAPRGESNYNSFKDRIAPRLQGNLEDGGKSPVQGLHPFRLHRVYLAASRLPPAAAAQLPWTVLETELRLKGESGEPDVALAEMVSTVAAALRPLPKSAARRG
jgi:DNA polymerase III subunit delta